jgi:hypothetical protein
MAPGSGHAYVGHAPLLLEVFAIRVRQNAIFHANQENPHDSPRLSDRPENVCEEWLLVQHAGGTLHELAQPTFRHHGD